MLQISVIGNIGANAELHTENGNNFVTFKVAHNERYVDAKGQQHDKTDWISCVLNGDGGKLREYLVKGTTVFVSGDAEVRTYHSQQQRALVAGINVRVRSISLVGGKVDQVPSVLFDTDGVQVNVMKCFFAPDKKKATLFDRAGNQYTTDKQGWVLPVSADQKQAGEQTDGAV